MLRDLDMNAAHFGGALLFPTFSLLALEKNMIRNSNPHSLLVREEGKLQAYLASPLLPSLIGIYSLQGYSVLVGSLA